jgi:hypothetical protein
MPFLRRTAESTELRTPLCSGLAGEMGQRPRVKCPMEADESSQIDSC